MPTGEAPDNGRAPDGEHEAAARHWAAAGRYREERDRWEAAGNRIALFRLLTFLVALVCGVSGVWQEAFGLLAAGVAGLLGFAGLVAAHARVIAARDLAETRREVQSAYLARVTDDWHALPNDGAGLVPGGHPYAPDIDLVGPGSLFQRLDVTHTVDGGRTLARWLAAPATVDEIAGRQAAVRELAAARELRQELEVAALVAAGGEKLDPAPFLAFTETPPLVLGKTWLVVAMHALPVLVLAALAAVGAGLLPSEAWLVPFAGTAGLGLWTAGPARKVFELAAARRGFGEAFERMLRLLESHRFEAPTLVALAKRLEAGGQPPSSSLRRLDRWLGLAALREQPLVQIPLQLTVLWDLHVLYRLERWNAEIGARMGELFAAVGELEALASLAVLVDGDPDATFPEVVAPGGALTADGLAHPLLPASLRVANDVALPGPGSALLVTGSNMAGKSTLLRSMALNVVLALAGGAVIARRMQVPRVRLRASMRAQDDLQRGASYFHAELTKLRTVIDRADEEPPILFVLDELLRGTNAEARHLGARAVLTHLLDRGGMGLVATHDTALGALADERPGKVRNVHFTDVMRDGEMVFDYRLRSGIVQGSNALRLLRQAGIDVADPSPEDRSSSAAAPAAGASPVDPSTTGGAGA